MSTPAIQTPRVSGAPKGAMLTLLATVFIALMGVWFVAPFLPILASDLGASGLAVGLLMGAFALSMGLFQPPAGFLSDRYGRKRFLAAGLAIYAICGFGYTLADSVLDITVIRFIQGLGAAVVFPVAMAYMADWAPANSEGRYMAIFNMALMAGIGTGPLLGGVLSDSFGILAAFYGMGAASALALLLTLLLLPEGGSARSAGSTVPLLTVFRGILGDRRMRGVLLVRISIMVGMVPTFVFLPVLMQDTMSASGIQIGIALTLRTLVSASLQFPFGWLADQYSRVRLTLASVLGAAAIISWVGFTTQLWQLLVLLTLLGAVEAIFLPATSAMAVEGGRSFGMGSAMGVFNSAMNVGMLVGAVVAGVLVDQVGFGFAFLLIGAAVAFTGLLAAPMLRAPAGVVLERQPTPTVMGSGRSIL